MLVVYMFHAWSEIGPATTARTLPRQGDVCTSALGEEADGCFAVGPDGRKDDDVLLAALEPVDGVDAQSQRTHSLHVRQMTPTETLCP